MSFTIKKYEIEIELLTGLHIGGADTAMKIGGVDKEVVKHPITNNPYIPGSSIKGKVRSLLEYSAGLRSISDKGSPYNTDIKIILQLFGAGAGNDSEGAKEIGITRLAFSDAMLNFSNSNAILTEVKAENSINRITGTASNPRFIERVVSGTKFTGAISMRLFPDDDEKVFSDKTAEGLWLLTQDALGAAGSRGYGRVSIKIVTDGELKTAFEKKCES